MLQGNYFWQASSLTTWDFGHVSLRRTDSNASQFPITGQEMAARRAEWFA